MRENGAPDDHSKSQLRDGNRTQSKFLSVLSVCRFRSFLYSRKSILTRCQRTKLLLLTVVCMSYKCTMIPKRIGIGTLSHGRTLCSSRAAVYSQVQSIMEVCKISPADGLHSPGGDEILAGRRRPGMVCQHIPRHFCRRHTWRNSHIFDSITKFRNSLIFMDFLHVLFEIYLDHFDFQLQPFDVLVKIYSRTTATEWHSPMRLTRSD